MITVGVGIQSNVISTQEKQSVFSKTADAAPKIVAVKNSSPSASKPGSDQQQTDGRSGDSGLKTDIHSTSGFVKVQAPVSEKTSPASVLTSTKCVSSSTPQCSKQGTNGEGVHFAFDSC